MPDVEVPGGAPAAPVIDPAPVVEAVSEVLAGAGAAVVQESERSTRALLVALLAALVVGLCVALWYFRATTPEPRGERRRER